LTKLYFHAASSTLTNLPTATQSATVSDKDVDAQTVNRTMSPSKGVSQTSLVLSSLANTSSNDYFFAKFVSEPLRGVTSISANTWNYAFAAAENNANANYPNGGSNLSVPTVAYVWRPSTQTKVGNIVDVVNSGATFSEPAAINTETSEFGTFAGSAVASVQDDDVIVFEYWARTTQGTATARNDTFYYDGTTETNNTGTTVSSHASYIETPQALRFLTIRAIAETAVSITDTLSKFLVPITSQDVKAFKGTITLDATGTIHDQAFTGVGFRPKAILFWGTFQTALDTYNEGDSVMYGFTDGTNSACTAAANVDNVATTDCSQMLRNDACIVLLTTAAGNAETIRGALKTFDSDGFTITWNVKDTTQYIIHYLALGGADMSNVFVAQTTTGTVGTGNRAYTGVGFKPDIVFFATCGNIAVNTLSAGFQIGHGVGRSTSEQYATSIQSQDNVAANSGGVQSAWISSANCLQQTRLANQNHNVRASLTSLDADGFTLNHLSAAAATTFPFAYMAVKGGYWSAGAFAKKTSTGLQTITPTVLADPEAFMLAFSDGNTDDNFYGAGGGSDPTVGIGGCDNTNEGHVFIGQVFQTSPTNPVMRSSVTKLIRNSQPNATATSSTTVSEGDISDMATSGQIVINWTTAAATARRIGYWSMMKKAGGGPQLFIRPITETAVTITDSIYRKLSAFRKIAEPTIVVTDTISRARLTKKRYIAETALTTTDTIARLKKAIRAINESLTTTDNIYRRKFAFRKINETALTTTDSIYRRLFAFRKINETALVTTDSVRPLSIKKRYIVETALTTTDSIYRRLIAKRYLLETVTVGTGTIYRRLFAFRKIAEPALVITDTVSRARALKKRYISETAITITDSCARILHAFRRLAETVTITDLLSRKAIKKRYLLESVLVTDFVSRFKKAIRRIDESLTITDSVIAAQTGARVRVINEAAITITDIVTKVAIRRRYITETVNITDNIIATKVAHAFTVVITEAAITITDTVAKQARKLRYLNESVSITDTVSRLKRAIRRINEAVTGTDSIYRRLFAYRRLNETTLVTDRLSKQATKKRYIKEIGLTTTDAIAIAHVIIIKIVDTVCTSATTGGPARIFHRIFGQNRASGF
jgi:hypothetical protein